MTTERLKRIKERALKYSSKIPVCTFNDLMLLIATVENELAEKEAQHD